MIIKPISVTKIQGTPMILKKLNKGFWNITFDNPPLNLFDPEFLTGLSIVMDQIESDPDVKVILFDSSVENYFIAHFDVARAAEMPNPKTASGLPLWIDIAQRLLNSAVISIASIRGRIRGIGIEFALACDMRFASRELAIFGQFEVGVNLIPGGGSMENLPVFLGRARAIEIIIGAQDINADLAERYGIINRAVSDAELDEFVYRLGWRISQFDPHIIGKAKAVINERAGGKPTAKDMLDSRDTFMQSMQRDEAKPVFKKLFEWGIQQDGDFELNVGSYLDKIGETID
ncbi:enoyl-CoA hydratase/isomerase family protein [Flavobacterium sp. 2]|uniref:enoyl-CoA hydratase/isomerase family protein n=1 Tax=Flavobacterium sp. 2 TaxID=308053 RepID=UPI003CF5CE37